MAGQTLNVAPSLGAVQFADAKQSAADFELLLNVDPTAGAHEPRKGWRVVRTVDTWAVANDSGGTPRYTTVGATYKAHCLEDNYQPLGAFLYPASDGTTHVIQVVRQVGGDFPNIVQVKTLAGTLLNQSFSIPGQPLVDADTGALTEPTDVPYTFAMHGRWVYFCNGGAVYRWKEGNFIVDGAQGAMETPPFPYQLGVPFYHNPTYPNAFIYLDEMHGASIVCEHNGSMVYAGFGAVTLLNADGVLNVQSDGISVSKTATKDGLLLGPDQQSIYVTPYSLVVSDPDLPRCLNTTNINTLGTRTPITGLASFRDQLVVFTSGEMLSYTGSVATGSATVSLVSSGVGCVAHRTIRTYKDSLLVWVAQDGVYTWDGSGQPTKISGDVDKMFRGVSEFQYPTKFLGVFKDASAPYLVQHSRLSLASAVIHPTRGFYCVALCAGVSRTPNGLQLCIDPSTGKCWFWSAGQEGLTPGGALDGFGCNAGGAYTLLAAPTVPRTIFCQGAMLRGITTEKLPRYTVSLCVQDGDFDERYIAAAAVSQPFNCIMITGRMWLGDSAEKSVRQLNLRMFAKSKADSIVIAYMPELAGFDIYNQLSDQGKSTEFDKIVVSWPDGGPTENGKYFWQDNAGTDAKWAAVPAPTPKHADNMFWQNTLVMDKRIDLPQYVTQFGRFMFWQKIGGSGDTIGTRPTMRLLSWGVGGVQSVGWGSRRS